jgi:hypothetical protein
MAKLRHAGVQEESILRGQWEEESMSPFVTLAYPGLRLNTFTSSCAESFIYIGAQFNSGVLRLRVQGQFGPSSVQKPWFLYNSKA